MGIFLAKLFVLLTDLVLQIVNYSDGIHQATYQTIQYLDQKLLNKEVGDSIWRRSFQLLIQSQNINSFEWSKLPQKSNCQKHSLLHNIKAKLSENAFNETCGLLQQ